MSTQASVRAAARSSASSGRWAERLDACLVQPGERDRERPGELELGPGGRQELLVRRSGVIGRVEGVHLVERRLQPVRRLEGGLAEEVAHLGGVGRRDGVVQLLVGSGVLLVQLAGEVGQLLVVRRSGSRRVGLRGVVVIAAGHQRRRRPSR